MSGSVILLAEKGQTAKIRKFFNKISEKIDDGIGGYYWSLPGPKIGELEIDRVILEINRDRIEIGYNFGQAGMPQEFAKAFAQALCNKFKFKRAGWDSIGYIPEKEGGLKYFLNRPLFPERNPGYVEAVYGPYGGTTKLSRGMRKHTKSLFGMPK